MKSDCPPHDTLAAWRRSPDATGDSAEVSEHLSSCPGCMAILETLSPTGGPPPPFELTAGAHAGRFVIEGRLGEGGMGVVYAARDPQLGRKVAVKVLRGGGDPDANARLLREAQAMARLAHPNVVVVFDSGVIADRLFVAMELVEGARLDRWLAEHKAGWRAVIELFSQAGRGLAAAHAAGIIHRDFKPANVLVGGDGRARVVDFGLARDEGAAAEPPVAGSPDVSPAGVTLTGTVLGTPAYMAPEQRRGERATARSDQYSFCVGLHESLFGVHPSRGRAPGKSPVPAAVRRVLARGLAPAPDDRWPSMEALLRALVAASPRRTGWILLGSAAALAIIALASYLPRGGPDPCAGIAGRLDGVWDAARKDTIHKAFLATGLPHAETRWRAAEGMLDAYAASYVQRSEALCAARGEQPAADIARRQACLDQRLEGLHAWATVFVTVDARRLRNATSSAAALDDLGVCASSDPDARPAPADRALAAEVARRRIELATLDVRVNSGELVPALEGLARLRAEARRIGYPPLEAEVLSSTVVSLMNVGKLDEAEAALDDLGALAEETRDDRLRASGWVTRVYLEAQRVRPAEAHRAARYADAVLRPMSGANSEWQRLMLANNEAHAYWDEHLHGHALMLSIAALARAETLIGREDIRLGPLLITQGSLLHFVGDLAAARERFERALAIVRRVNGDEHAMVPMLEANLAGVYDDLGDHAAQLALAERAEAHMRAIHGPEHVLTAQATLVVAKALIAVGRAGEALAGLARAEAAIGDGHPLMPHVLAMRGLAQLESGRAAEAAVTLEAALARNLELDTGPADIAAVRFDLARALWSSGGDRARARTLAEEARLALDAAVHARKRAEIEAWLASRRSI